MPEPTQQGTVRGRAIVRGAGETLDFHPLTELMEAMMRARAADGAAIIVRNRFGEVLYHRQFWSLGQARKVPLAFRQLIRDMQDLLTVDIGNDLLLQQVSDVLVTLLADHFSDEAPESDMPDELVALEGWDLEDNALVFRDRTGQIAWLDVKSGIAGLLCLDGAGPVQGLDHAVIDTCRGIITHESMTAMRMTFAPLQEAQAGTASEHSVKAGSVEGNYLLYRPAKIREPAPLVVMLHRGGTNGARAREETGWDATADKYGFLLAYPDGGWNDGSGRGRGRDDVAFLRAVIDDMVKSPDVDAKRVYLTGQMIGASMAFRAAYEMSDRITAIAPVSGHFMLENLRPLPVPVPLICFLGTDDLANPIREDVMRVSGGTGITKPQVRDSVLKWVHVLGLSTASHLKVTSEGWWHETFGPAEDGGAAEFYLVPGMSIRWPGEIGINERIWAFFTEHVRE